MARLPRFRLRAAVPFALVLLLFLPAWSTSWSSTSAPPVHVTGPSQGAIATGGGAAHSRRTPAEVPLAIPVGTDPSSITVDPVTGNIYVSNLGSNNISVISPTTDTVIYSLPAGLGPEGAAYDPVNGDLYVADVDSDNVTVIDLSTHASVASIGVGSAPRGVAWDSADGLVYVANFGRSVPSNISIIDPTTQTTVGSISTAVGGDSAIVFDAVSGDLYVNNLGDLVQVIDPASQQVVQNVTLPAGPDGNDGLAVQSGTGDVFVATEDLTGPDDSDRNVTVIDPLTNRAFLNLTAGDGPSGVAFNATSGLLVVVNEASDNVSIMNPATGEVLEWYLVGMYPGGVAFDPVNQKVYVADENSENVIVLGAGPASVDTVSFEVTPASCGPVSFNGSAQASGSSAEFPSGTYTVHAPDCVGHNLSSAVFRGDNGFTQALATSWGNVTVSSNGTLWVNYTSAASFVPILEAQGLSVGGGTTLTDGASYPLRVNVTNVGGADSGARDTSVNFSYAPPSGGPTTILGMDGQWYGWLGGVENSTPSLGPTTSIPYGATDTAVYEKFVPPSDLAGEYDLCANATSSNEPAGDYKTGANVDCLLVSFVGPQVPLVAFGNATISGYPGSCGSGGIPGVLENVSFGGNARGGTPGYAFSWTFGDGSPAVAGRNVTHGYASLGDQNGTLLVTDSVGRTVSVVVEFVGPKDPAFSCPPKIFPGFTGPLGLTTAGVLVLIVLPVVAVVAVLSTVLLLRRRRTHPPPREPPTLGATSSSTENWGPSDL